jgi:hypothetical protein
MPNPIDPTLLAKLKAEHGEVFHLETDWGDLVFRGASQEEFDRFTREVADPVTKQSGIRTLLGSCVLHPAAEEFYALLRRKPAITLTLGNKLTAFMGAREGAIREK